MTDDDSKPDAPQVPTPKAATATASPTEPTVKQLLAGAGLSEVIDANARAELERWFGLPSFAQVEDQQRAAAKAADGDPRDQAARDARAAALAAIDPAFYAALRVRSDRAGTMIVPKPFEVHVDPTISRLDYAMIDGKVSLAEPREVEMPPDLEDVLKECTPQALLRDLHRPELDFDKIFEIVDHSAELRVDGVKEVATAMATSWKLPAFGASPLVEARAIFAELRVLRSMAVSDIPMKNRTVQE